MTDMIRPRRKAVQICTDIGIREEGGCPWLYALCDDGLIFTCRTWPWEQANWRMVTDVPQYRVDYKRMED